MEPSTVTEPREEKLQRLHDERANLIAQIERLQEQADAAQGGIRLYRNQRVDQFRERDREFLNRLARIEAGSVEGCFEDEAETLYEDLKETSNLASHTFQQIMKA